MNFDPYDPRTMRTTTRLLKVCFVAICIAAVVSVVIAVTR